MTSVKVPIRPPALKVKLPPPPLVCLDTVRLATAWLVKAQPPLAPGVVRVTLPLLLQPPLELKPALANSLTVTVAGTLTVKAVVVTPPVGMTKVKVPIPPPALKVKLPPPPLVCLDTVRLATAWLVKAQLVLTRTIAVTLVPPPFCNGPSGGGGGGSAQPPLELKPALANSLTVTVAGTLTVKAVVVTPPVGMTSVKVPIPPPALKVKLPPPPLVCLDTVRLATAWMVKAQLPLDPAVLRVTLPLLLQPPLELKPALANSLTVTVAGTLTVKAVALPMSVGMTSVKVPIPPPALKVKLPPPPLVCLDTVRLATAWLVKAQLVLTRTIAVTLVPPPFCNGPSGGGGGGSAQPPLELKPALANS